VRIVKGDFEWDSAKAARNERKHRVFEEAATVLRDPYAVDAPDFDDPMRFVLVGMSETLRVLFVVACESTGARIRIISARRASAAQRRLYERRT
jgi:uncharacterized DUF497 family protein